MLRSLRAWLVCALVVGAGVCAGLLLPAERPAAEPAPAPSGGIAGICMVGAEDCEDESFRSSTTISIESP